MISFEFQKDWPIFVRSRYDKVIYKGKEFEYQYHIPWKEMNIPEEVVKAWFLADLVYHDTDLEKETKVGDRLSEFDGSDLKKIVDSLNTILKQRTNSTNEFNSKRCRQSTIDDKQRGLIRSWLRSNRWAEDDFFAIRDKLLGE